MRRNINVISQNVFEEAAVHVFGVEYKRFEL